MIGNAIAPLKIKAKDPNPSPGADTYGFGIAQDGQTYVIKSPVTHRLLPATEAFCEALADACQLPVTVGAWIEMDGISCYGSRFEGGLEKALASGFLAIQSRKRTWKRCTNPALASAVFALDLFVFNYDRHHNNWAFQNQNGNLTARIFDFSRAWWTCASDLSELPHPSDMQALPKNSERTCQVFKEVQSWVGLDLLSAQNVLDLLKRIDTHWVKKRIEELPSGWVDTGTLDSTLAWWDSPQKLARIASIEEGLKNGTLF